MDLPSLFLIYPLPLSPSGCRRLIVVDRPQSVNLFSCCLSRPRPSEKRIKRYSIPAQRGISHLLYLAFFFSAAPRLFLPWLTGQLLVLLAVAAQPDARTPSIPRKPSAAPGLHLPPVPIRPISDTIGLVPQQSFFLPPPPFPLISSRAPVQLSRTLLVKSAHNTFFLPFLFALLLLHRRSIASCRPRRSSFAGTHRRVGPHI